MKRMFLLLSCLALFGCATSSINKNYSRINYSDGISRREVKVIAQKQLISTENKTEYIFTSPQLISNFIVRDYPDYWFISFDAKKFEDSFWKYLVVVSKDTGEVIFSDQYVPLGITNYDWVFKKK